MLKYFYERYYTKPVMSQNTDDTHDVFVIDSRCCDIRLEFADILSNLESKVSHLEQSQQEELTALRKDYENLFGDEPGITHFACHAMAVGPARPI